MSSTGNTNPGNFANRPKEEVQEIASKGGQSSHNSGFASMDPDKQVSATASPDYLPMHLSPPLLSRRTDFDRLSAEGHRVSGRSSIERFL